MSMKVWNHVEAPGGGSGPLVRNHCEVGLPYTACLPPVPSPTTSPSSPSFTLTRSISVYFHSNLMKWVLMTLFHRVGN